MLEKCPRITLLNVTNVSVQNLEFPKVHRISLNALAAYGIKI